MSRGLRVNVIDQDALLLKCGSLVMVPSDRVAVVLDEAADEAAVRRFFADNWGVELERNYFNELIEARLGLRTLSARTQLCPGLETHPDVATVVVPSESKSASADKSPRTAKVTTRGQAGEGRGN